MRSQIEILASLQTVDREIKEQKEIKQELLGELQSKENEIDSKKREIGLLTAAHSEKDLAFAVEAFRKVGKKFGVV